MALSETPTKRGPNVPAGCILVNERWRGSSLEKGLSGVGKGIYCDKLGYVDFYPSELCPVIYINEGELISAVPYERKLQKLLQVVEHRGVVIADRNNLTIRQFSELQDRCFLLNLTLIPIGNVSELPQLLVQMAYVESKSPSNPFKQRQKSCDDLATQQLKLFTLIPGVGEKKARLLLDNFGHPQGLISLPEDKLVEKLSPLIGESSAQNIYNCYYKRIKLK